MDTNGPRLMGNKTVQFPNSKRTISRQDSRAHKAKPGSTEQYPVPAEVSLLETWLKAQTDSGPRS